MGTKYVQIYDGDWVQPRSRRGHKMRCCDCGLVHVVNFRVRGGKLQFQVFRDDRATAASRRGKRREQP